MNTVRARVSWIKNNELEGLTASGHKVKMNSGPQSESASPAELLLQSLAGCSMMDCVLIITKSRKRLEKFWVEIEAEEAETFPKVYTAIHLTYYFSGPDLTDELIRRAIGLSREKYCKIYAMLHKSVNITSSYTLNEVKEFESIPVF
jgi:putative redox protein